MSLGLTADTWDCKTNILKGGRKQRVLLFGVEISLVHSKIGENPKVLARSKFHSFELFRDTKQVDAKHLLITPRKLSCSTENRGEHRH